MKLRTKVFEEIDRAKVHCPAAFIFLKNIEELLKDSIIVPKEKAKIENIDFVQDRNENIRYSDINMKGTLSFNAAIQYCNKLNDDFIDNFIKEQIRDELVNFMESEENEGKNKEKI